MNKKQAAFIYSFFLLIYVALIFKNVLSGSQWVLDNILSIIFLTFMYLIRRWIRLGRTTFILFNIALLMHNMGSFDFYELSFFALGYDNFVHFLSSLVAALILSNFIFRRLHIRKNKLIKDSVIDEHILVIVFLVIASVAMLGVMIELLEFTGHFFLGSGEGILFTGPGDRQVDSSFDSQYVDTMTDIVVNTLGSITGVYLYYRFRYKKRSFLKRYGPD